MMVFLMVVTFFIGAMFLWMGALICFRGRTGLICNYIADEKAGRFDAAYARRVGVIQLAGGAGCAASAIGALFIGSAALSAVLMLGCIVGSLIAYQVNYRRSANLSARA